jgi:glycosyltransferase involved in cell wall biosynthesis
MIRRVRFVLSGLSRSGGSGVVLAYASALVSAGWRVELVLPGYSPHLPADLGGVAVATIRPRSGGKFGRIEYLFRLSMQRHSEAETCIVGSFRLLIPLVWSSVLGRGPRKTIFFAQHLSPLGWMPTSRVGSAAVGVIRGVLYRVPGVNYVAVSDWLRREARGKDWHVIPNGIDTELFRPGTRVETTERRRRLRVGVIARPGPEKGLDVFEAALEFGRRSLPERAEIVVCSPERARLDVPNEYHVHYLGTLEHAAMPGFYRSLDLFVSPSRQEGFGLTPLEAMACGTPTVLSDCLGHLQYATSANAFLFRSGDGQSLCQVLSGALEDSDRRSEAARHALSTSRRFGAAASSEAFVELVESLAGRAQ